MTTPSYVSLITLNSKTIDIAALGQKISAPVQEDSHIVKTELIYLGKDEFKQLFFSNDGENFSINRQLYEEYVCNNSNSDINIKEFNDAMTFNKRFKMIDTDSNHIEPLSLTEHIFSCYESDTGTDRDCWEVCSVMQMTKTLNSIKCLCDMGSGCNVLTSLKWSEIENIIKNDTINYYNNPASQTGNLIIDNDPTRHILQISTVFKSSSPEIKDCIIIFRYAVDMRDSSISTNKYFRFGNPEYLLNDLIVKSNNVNLDINFKTDIFRYTSHIFANNTFDISVNPVVLSNSIFNIDTNYQRQPLTIDVCWFNDVETTDHKNSGYQAFTSFNENDAIANSYKKLQPRDVNNEPTYSDILKKPLLRFVIKNKNDDIGDTITTYEIQLTIMNTE